MNPYPTTAAASKTRTDRRVWKNQYGAFEAKANMADIRAYAQQCMSEDISRLAARAREAQCYKRQCMSDPYVKGSMFSMAVKVTLVAFARRRGEYEAVLAANKAAQEKAS